MDRVLAQRIVLGLMLVFVQALSARSEQEAYKITFAATLDKVSLPTGSRLVSDIPLGSTVSGELIIPRNNLPKRVDDGVSSGTHWLGVGLRLKTEGVVRTLFHGGGGFNVGGDGLLISNAPNTCVQTHCDADGRIIQTQSDDKASVAYVPSRYLISQRTGHPDRNVPIDEIVSNTIEQSQAGQTRLMLVFADFQNRPGLRMLFTVSQMQLNP